MNRIKTIIKKIFGNNFSKKLSKIISFSNNFIDLIINNYIDGKLFYRHSMVFKLNTFNKIESEIILYYHGIEKGFLHSQFRFRFGEDNIKRLVNLLKKEEVAKNIKKTQIAAAFLAMCRYYEIHKNNNIDINDYYKESDYKYFKSLSTLDLDVTEIINNSSYFEYKDSDFLLFSKSRSSIRSFTGERIPLETLNKVIEIAKTAPSVCNRQPTKVYCVENKDTIDKILLLQRGLKGFSSEINQLLILTCDRNYFYTIGERNQLYIDGGLFLMNLLYSLHYYKIAASPAHWGFNHKHDNKIKNILNLRNSEKVISLIAIGIPKDEAKTTLSLRRDNEEILVVVK